MPRSLARTAVHPPHRIGSSRSKPLNVFVCGLLSVVGLVLIGIVYFLFDLNSSQASADSPNSQESGFGASTSISNAINKFRFSNNDDYENTKGGSKSWGFWNNDGNNNDGNNDGNNDDNNDDSDDTDKDDTDNDDSNDDNRNEDRIGNYNQDDVNTIIKSFNLENLVRPDRDNIHTKIDESRLIEILPPNIESPSNDNNNNGEANDEQSKDVDGNSASLDEPFDEETATHLLRKDIDPSNEECQKRFEELSKGNIFEQARNLSLQSKVFSQIENDNDYIDWWDFPKQYQTKLDSDKYCNTIHKGSFELHTTRAEWFDKMKKDGKVSRINSNKFDENGCVIYKMTDDYVQWHPPKHLLCHWKNTATFWHTMHGTKIGYDFRNAKNGDHWVWDLSTELNDERQGNKCECPSDVAFIFADNQNKDNGYRLIERSYINCNKNCHYFHVAQNYAPWDWYGKIGPVLELISNKTFQEQFKYAILTDADDQTLIKSPIDIIDKFKVYEADMVIGGEDTSYPQWQYQEKAHENRASPWSRHHQHLNAGAFMGEITKMIPYLEYMTKDYENFTIMHEEEIKAGERNKWRDQTCWREMYRKFYPKIKVDSLAMLWSRVDIYMYDL